ncbi:GNAT family N-acetyltransferase [Salinibius halmophilus]|uniref:GNAT family N-acetyltransferase n=1 Tax=Salinibius halmophilus TaxID=1853216 RepID=UPI000E673160|nr:GNAT family N-acetyltransferase [Salinibius halmophilus]
MDHSHITIEQVAHPVVMYLRQKVFCPDESPAACMQTGDEHALHFAAFLHDQLVAVVSVFIDGSSAQLSQLATDPEFRGQRIGSQLIQYVQNELARHGITHLVCKISKALGPLFFRLGFTLQNKGQNSEEEGYLSVEYWLAQ